LARITAVLLAYFADLHSEVFKIENYSRSGVDEDSIPLYYNLLQFFLALLTQQCSIMSHKFQVLGCRTVHIVAFVL